MIAYLEARLQLVCSKINRSVHARIQVNEGRSVAPCASAKICIADFYCLTSNKLDWWTDLSLSQSWKCFATCSGLLMSASDRLPVQIRSTCLCRYVKRGMWRTRRCIRSQQDLAWLVGSVHPKIARKKDLFSIPLLRKDLLIANKLDVMSQKMHQLCQSIVSLKKQFVMNRVMVSTRGSDFFKGSCGSSNSTLCVQACAVRRKCGSRDLGRSKQLMWEPACFGFLVDSKLGSLLAQN